LPSLAERHAAAMPAASARRLLIGAPRHLRPRRPPWGARGAMVLSTGASYVQFVAGLLCLSSAGLPAIARAGGRHGRAGHECRSGGQRIAHGCHFTARRDPVDAAPPPARAHHAGECPRFPPLWLCALPTECDRVAAGDECGLRLAPIARARRPISPGAAAAAGLWTSLCNHAPSKRIQHDRGPDPPLRWL